MKKLALTLATLALTVAAHASAVYLNNDITAEIPSIEISPITGFDKINDVAQYKNADWSQILGIARNISLDQAVKIANEQYPQTTFFFHVKGEQMVLEKENGDYRVFRHGDTVFFSGQPWWGSAPGLADGYVRQ
ncbi:MAG: hypothetical protein H0U49_11455 [Parachlamydiaceae bacterium]|nr:hypothetical protein [Parachlamydiaceae bacterium]